MKLINTFSSLSITKKLILLFILALVIRLLSYYTHPYIHSDSVTYLSINYHDSNGELQKGLDLHRQLPPAILYFMRIFSTLGINVEIGYRLTSLILYTVLIFPFFYIARNIVSEEAALFAVFCYVCHPKTIGYSHAVLRESLSVPFMFYGLALIILSFEKNKTRYSILAGVCIAISYMSRLEYGIAFILGLLFFSVFVISGVLKNSVDSKRNYLIKPVALVSIMVLILLLVNLNMKSYNSYWDPFAYRKVKGFMMRTFND